ncbi:MAG: cysteine peptidase family C39 domain-containing protein [Pseudomonadota bacterium]
MRPGRRTLRYRAEAILQMEAAECGAACLAMVLSAYGRYVALEEARSRCGVGRDGASVPAIARAAETYGLTTKALRREPQTLKDLPLPAILHWSFDHFVVLERISGGRFHLIDPAVGRRSVDASEMGRCFTGIALAFAPELDFKPGGKRQSTFSALKKWSSGSWDGMGLVFLLGLIGVVPGLVASGAVSTFSTYVIGQERPIWLIAVVLALAVAILMQAGIAWMQARIVAALRAKVSAIVSARTFERLLLLPLKFFAQRDASELVARLRVGAEIGSTIAGPMAGLAPTIVTGLAYIGVIGLYDPILGAVVAGIALANALIIASLSRRMTGSARLSNVLQGVASGVATSGFAAFGAYRSLGQESLLARRWMNAEEAALDAEQRLGTHRILAKLGPNASELLIAITVLSAGAFRTMQGDIAMGDLLALQVLAGFAAGPVSQTAQYVCALQQSAGPLSRLDDIENYPLDPIVGPNTRPFRTRPLGSSVLEIDDVSFAYEASAPLFANVSLSLEPGTVTGILGPSGSGKSTLAKIAAGMFSPTEGAVRLGGRHLHSWSHQDLRKRLQYVPQSSSLITGSIKDNITMYDSSISDEAIANALELAGAAGFVSRAGGVEAQVSSHNPCFSGGEIQRLALARALAREPDVLVLDEVTSALDNETERAVMASLKSFGGVVLLVTHRQGSMTRCDSIVVIEAGEAKTLDAAKALRHA